MKAPKCRSCGKEHWGSVCRPEKSSAVRMDAPNQNDIGRSAPNASVAGTQAPPVDTNLRSRLMDQLIADSADELFPIKPFNKTDYQKRYMADLRTIKRLGLSVTVKQYRESLK